MLALGIQIVSFVIILTIMAYYMKNIRDFFRRKNIILISAKLFTIFLMLAFVNTILDGISLWTLYNYENTNHLVADICNRLFIASINYMIFFLFLYVAMIARSQKRYGKKQIMLMSIPVDITFIMILFGELDYSVAESGRYLYGPVLKVLNISVGFYILWIIVLLIMGRKKFANHSGSTILSGVLVWCFICGIQFFHPAISISSMAIALMVLLLFIAQENPREFADYEVKGVFNAHNFQMILTEMIERKRKFYVINIVLSNAQFIKRTSGNGEVFTILEKVAEHFNQYKYLSVFHSKENVISVVVSLEEQYEEIMSGKIEEIKHLDTRGALITPKFYASIIAAPEYAKTVEDVMDLINFVCIDCEQNAREGVSIVDNDVISKKQYMKQVENIVQEAIKNDGFDVYYQPIYNTEKKMFTSAEALVRLKDTQTLGFISPEIFIPVSEKNGMIFELGDIVFAKVCEFASRMSLWEMGVEYIEVNISGAQSIDESLSERLEKCMQQYNIKPNFINIEITETASVEAEEVLQRNMIQLRKMGCSFSMDDFGTGYSNLAKMADTHFELIKLDKSLIWPAFSEDSEKAMTILKSCITMIHSLGMHIVAEGIETEEMVNFLTEQNVRYLQGYYFSRPLPEADYVKYIQ